MIVRLNVTTQLSATTVTYRSLQLSNQRRVGNSSLPNQRTVPYSDQTNVLKCQTDDLLATAVKPTYNLIQQSIEFKVRCYGQTNVTSATTVKQTYRSLHRSNQRTFHYYGQTNVHFATTYGQTNVGLPSAAAVKHAHCKHGLTQRRINYGASCTCNEVLRQIIMPSGAFAIHPRSV